MNPSIRLGGLEGGDVAYIEVDIQICSGAGGVFAAVFTE